MDEKTLQAIEERAKRSAMAGETSWSRDVPALVEEVRALRKACEAALWAIEDYEREGHPGEDLRPMLRNLLD